MRGWLWEQTAKDRKPTTYRIFNLAKELNRRRDEYDTLGGAAVGPVHIGVE